MRSQVRFLLSVIAPYRWFIVAQVAISVIWAVDLSLRPYLVKTMLDGLVDGRELEAYAALVIPALSYLALGGITVVSYRLYDYVWLHLNAPLKRTLGMMLMDRMMLQSHSFYQNHFAGALGSIIKDVMSGVPDFLKILIDKFFATTLALFIATFTLWTVDGRFAWALLAWVFFFVMVSQRMSRKAQSLSSKSASARSLAIGSIVDVLSNMMSVRFFASRKTERHYLKKVLDDSVVADQERDWFLLKMFAVQGVSFVAYQGISLFWLISFYSKGLVTAGDFALILTINISIIETLWHLTWDMSEAVELTGTIKHGLNLIMEPTDIQDEPGASELKVTRGEIVFDEVQFFYEGSEPLFQNKSVVIEPGQKVGLVGYSGSGKTTFINLILRLFDVNSGRILIDGQDIKEVTQDSLHRAIGVIPQDPSLFNRTLKENIRYGKPDATDIEIIAAARRAYAHDFIMALQDGYDTMVGERGLKLSGGQRQRIAIARAILKNAPILILDEATSQLDSITERYIQDSLQSLMQGKTTLVIAHRLSTLLSMDRLLVFERGQIVQDGTHDELLAQDGLYKTLWQAQTGDVLFKETTID
jgi:ATP-binding cassette subfamily B protein